MFIWVLYLFVGFILKSFIFSDSAVNGFFSSTIFSNCSMLVYRNTTKFEYVYHQAS